MLHLMVVVTGIEAQVMSVVAYYTIRNVTLDSQFDKTKEKMQIVLQYSNISLPPEDFLPFFISSVSLHLDLCFSYHWRWQHHLCAMERILTVNSYTC